MSIIALPPELLRHIFSYLGPFELHYVVQTGSKALRRAADSFYVPSRWWVKNAKRMAQRGIFLLDTISPDSPFIHVPKFSFPWHLPALDLEYGPLMSWEWLPKRVYAQLGLNSDCYGYHAISPPDIRSWLDLDDSFSWLPLLTGRLYFETKSTIRFRTSELRSRLNSLLLQAKKLDVQVPQSFINFFTNKHFLSRVPATNGYRWFLSPQIALCPAIVNCRPRQGYLILFCRCEEKCAFIYLYLEKPNFHCVVMTHGYSLTVDANVGILGQSEDDDNKSPYHRLWKEKYSTQRSEETQSQHNETWEEQSRQGNKRKSKNRKGQSNKSRKSAVQRAEEQDIRFYFGLARDLIKAERLTDEEVDFATSQGIQVALSFAETFNRKISPRGHNCYILGLTFEEYTVSYYFEQLIQILISEEQAKKFEIVPSRALKDYAVHRFRRVMVKSGLAVPHNYFDFEWDEITDQESMLFNLPLDEDYALLMEKMLNSAPSFHLSG